MNEALHMTGIVQDFRYAIRGLRRNPGFTAVAMLTLALGIGANTAIFSVLHGVLLKPLPLHEPESLVALWHRAPGLNIALLEQGPATYFTYRESNRVFEDIGLWNSEEVSITGDGEPERAQALWVTDGVLPILRVPPLHGRLFTQADDGPGSSQASDIDTRVLAASVRWRSRSRRSIVEYQWQAVRSDRHSAAHVQVPAD
jgi:putative ABC transport system permease protein